MGIQREIALDSVIQIHFETRLVVTWVLRFGGYLPCFCLLAPYTFGHVVSCLFGRVSSCFESDVVLDKIWPKEWP